MKLGSAEVGAGKDRAIARAVSFVLRLGVLVSAGIVCLGIALWIAGLSISPGGAQAASSHGQVGSGPSLAGLAAFDPRSIIALGLMVLIATPVLRVAVSIIAFSVEGDRRYALITALVLAILVTGMLMHLAIG